MGPLKHRIRTVVLVSGMVVVSYTGCRTTRVILPDDDCEQRCTARVEESVEQALNAERRVAAERNAAERAAVARRHQEELRVVEDRYQASVQALQLNLAKMEELLVESETESARLRQATESATREATRWKAGRADLRNQLTLAERQLAEMRAIAQSRTGPAGSESRPDEFKGVTLGTAAVNCPERMRQGKEYDLTAAISIVRNDKELLQQIGGARAASGSWETAVSKTMSVWVEAPAFLVKPEKQERQLITGTPATWKWKVTPLLPGPQKVIVHTAMILKVDDIETQKVFQLPPREITVDVDRLYRPVGFAKDNWQWLMSAIFIPALIFAYRKGSNKEKKRQQAGFRPDAG
jgi:hypothetical protein